MNIFRFIRTQIAKLILPKDLSQSEKSSLLSNKPRKSNMPGRQKKGTKLVTKTKSSKELSRQEYENTLKKFFPKGEFSVGISSNTTVENERLSKAIASSGKRAIKLDIEARKYEYNKQIKELRERTKAEKKRERELDKYIARANKAVDRSWRKEIREALKSVGKDIAKLEKQNSLTKAYTIKREYGLIIDKKGNEVILPESSSLIRGIEEALAMSDISYESLERRLHLAKYGLTLDDVAQYMSNVRWLEDNELFYSEGSVEFDPNYFARKLREFVQDYLEEIIGASKASTQQKKIGLAAVRQDFAEDEFENLEL